MNANASQGLLSRQWSDYGRVHRDRRNLLLHLVTAPIFAASSVAVVLAPWTHLWLAPLGLALMLLVVALQGGGHKLEGAAPAPFRDRLDIVLRIVAEQWITFPRYVLSGAFFRAIRQA